VTQIETEITRYTVIDDIEEICMNLYLSSISSLLFADEEVVPFERYMADAAHPEGNTFTFSSKIGSDASIFYDHPEVSLFWFTLLTGPRDT
jgi:hypothetical protein